MKRKGLDADGDAFHDWFKFFAAKHGDGALIVGRKVLAIGDGGAELDHCGSFKDGAIGSQTMTLEYFVSQRSLAEVYGMKADSSSQLK